MKRKYVSLTAEDKLSLIKKIENGCEKRKVAEEFGVGYSTACAIVKDKTRLLAAENSGQNLIKRNRQLKYDNIDKAVAIWFDQMRTANVPVNGDMVRAKAKEFGNQFGETSFEASNGWLCRFKLRLVVVHTKNMLLFVVRVLHVTYF